MQRLVSTIKADMDYLGLQSIFRIRNWHKNWILRYEGFAANRNKGTDPIRNIQEADLSSQ